MGMGILLRGATVGRPPGMADPDTATVVFSMNRRFKIGPFARLRPASRIAAGAKIGNFVEVKKSTVGAGSKVNHLSYIGDTVIGKGVNVGAGTITCNYDGVRKHQTIIGDGVFVGSDVQFIAPVRIGRDAVIAAGSTVTRDVPAGALAISRTPQSNKPGWSKKRFSIQKRKKK